MIKTVDAFCRQHGLLCQGETLVIACSGGPDSLALLDVLTQLRSEYDLHLVVCYVHHGIRQAADKEADFVKEEALRRQCRFVRQSADVPALARQRHMSLEAVGRTERYRILRETAVSCGAAAIAVAHHQNDQAETVLLHLLRGSGLTGLSGMAPKNGDIIRPLLAVTRQDIEEYIQVRGLCPQHDETNDLQIFMRNRVRLSLLPELMRYNQSVLNDLNRLSDIVRADDEVLCHMAKVLYDQHVQDTGDGAAIEKKVFLAQPLAMQRRLIRLMFRQVTGYELDISFQHVETIRNLARKPSGKQFCTAAVRAYITYHQLCVAVPRKKTEKVVPQESLAIRGAGEYSFGLYTVTIQLSAAPPTHADSHMFVFDYDQCPADLTLRCRRSGDTIRLQTGCRKSLKKYFNEKKIPVELRGNIPIICSGSAVFWIYGETCSAEAFIQHTTTTYLIGNVSGGNVHA